MAGMKFGQFGGRLLTGPALLALLAASGQKDAILPGARLPIRPDH